MFFKKIVSLIINFFFVLWSAVVLLAYFYHHFNYGDAFVFSTKWIFIILVTLLFVQIMLRILKITSLQQEMIKILNSRDTVYVPARFLIWYFLTSGVLWIVIGYSWTGDAQTVIRDICSLILVPAIFLAAYGLGLKITNLFRYVHNSWFEKVLLSAAIGFGVIMFFVFSLGMIGWLYPAVAYGFFIGIFVLCHKEIFEFIRLAWSAKLSWPLKPLISFKNFSIIVSLLIAGIMLAGLFGQFALGWDELHMYQSFPKIYAESHKIVNFPYWFHAGFPQNGEMLFTFGYLLYDFPVAAGLNVVFLFLTGLALILIQKSLFKKSSAWTLMLFYFSIPLLSRFIFFDHKIDLIFTFYSLLAVFYLFQFLKKSDKKTLIILSVIIGIAAGTKYTFFTLVLPSLVVAMLLNQTISLKKRFLSIIFCGLIAGALFSPWAAKNIIFYGNPVEPMFGDELSSKSTFFKKIDRSYAQHLREHFSDPKIFYEDQEIKNWQFFLMLPLRLSFNFSQDNYVEIANIGLMFLLLMPGLLYFLLLVKKERNIKVFLVILLIQLLCWFIFSDYIIWHGLALLLLLLPLLGQSLPFLSRDKFFKFASYLTVGLFSVSVLFAYFNYAIFCAQISIQDKSQISIFLIGKYLNNHPTGLIWNQGPALYNYVLKSQDRIIYDANSFLVFNHIYQTYPGNLAMQKIKDLGVKYFVVDTGSINYILRKAEAREKVSPKTAKLFSEAQMNFWKFKNKYLRLRMVADTIYLYELK